MTPTQISDYLQGLVSRKLEPDHRLSSETHRNWDEITSGQLDFDRRRLEIEALQKIDDGDLLQFFDRYILEGGNERRVLTSEVFAKKFSSEMELPSTAEASTVLDANNWQHDQKKYPVRLRHT
ncbi:unnamed protein product [Scytosiphon promiscuus]